MKRDGRHNAPPPISPLDYHAGVLLLLACALPGSPAPAPVAEPPVAPTAPVTAPAEAPVSPTFGACAAPLQTEVYGYTGSDACRAGQARWAHVPTADRDCATDADCAVVTADSCFHIVVAKAAAPAYSAEHPCVHPNAGMCPPQSVVAACEAGCCVMR